jgi:hypothetical protein
MLATINFIRLLLDLRQSVHLRNRKCVLFPIRFGRVFEFGKLNYILSNKRSRAHDCFVQYEDKAQHSMIYVFCFFVLCANFFS